ncbi:MAG TPA: NUDIX domain-containing protein [Dehalococcoidia bacterium]
MADETVKVAMVILHREGRVLMQLRGGDPGVYAGGMWGIFGGRMEPSESPERTAVREIEEELGIALDGTLALVVHRIDDGRERFIYAAPLTAPLETVKLAEGDGMALLSPQQIESYPVVPIHREVLRAWWQTPRE